MRKLFMRRLLGLLVVLAPFLFIGATLPFLTQEPLPVEIKALSEEDIKAQFNAERQEKKIEAATEVAAQIYRFNRCGTSFSRLTAEAALEVGLSPRLLAGLTFVESSGNPHAVSKGGDIGLMQVNARIWKIPRHRLLDPRQNLKIGAHILARLVRQYGLVEGLHHYNGLGRKDNSYAFAVLHAARMKIPA